MGSSFKLGPSVLLELIEIARNGIVKQIDVSQALREIEVEDAGDGTVKLTDSYLKARGRLEKPTDADL